jgi:hypothetical protein
MIMRRDEGSRQHEFLIPDKTQMRRVLHLL